MRYRTYAAAGLLTAIAACSASGAVDDPKPDAGGPQGDASAPELDGGAPVDATPDLDPDAERPLACGDAGFCETRLPRSELGLPLSLRSVWAVGSNDVWTVTIEGLVLHYDGTSWTTAYRANHELYAVWATPTSVWVGGEAGLLLHRNAAGQWSHTEPGHVAPIRAIYGTSDADVWLARDGASVDHFDGTTLTNYPIDIPGLRVTTIFGRPGAGTYAAGHVKGTIPGDMVQWQPYVIPDQPYVFDLSMGRISVFSASLAEKRAFVPLSGVVTGSLDDGRRIFMAGYEHSMIQAGDQTVNHSTMKYCTVGAEAPSDIKGFDVYLEYGREVDVQEFTVRAPPMLTSTAEDVWILWRMGQTLRWDGTQFNVGSLAMGYDHVPKYIFGAHRNEADVWIVGDGFALKGATP
ncbi:MAG: hypothetical protein K0S65_4712 [Labilithrix sp.]|nr:hypothetical protein [Labilithrix sp.]